MELVLFNFYFFSYFFFNFLQVVLAVATRYQLALVNYILHKLKLQVVHKEDYTWEKGGDTIQHKPKFFSQIRIIFKLQILNFLNWKIVLITICWFT